MTVRQETRFPAKATLGEIVRKADGVFVFPGFCDVHVHFREPGFSYKETIMTGSRAAAAGGYTAVCAMPNLNPVPDSLPHLAEEEELIRQAGDYAAVLPYAALTVGEKGQEAAEKRPAPPRGGTGPVVKPCLKAFFAILPRSGNPRSSGCSRSRSGRTSSPYSLRSSR